MRGSAVGLIALIFLVCAATAVATPQSSADVRTYVQAAVTRAARDPAVLVDPRVTGEIVASVGIFAANFCYPPDSKEGMARCRATVQDPVALATAVKGFLIDSSLPNNRLVKSVGARLATSLGMDFERAGWGSLNENHTGVVTLPERFSNYQIWLQTASGRVPLGTGAAKILLAPGQHELIATDHERESRFEVAVTEHTVTALAAPELPGVREPLRQVSGRIEPDPSMFCYERTSGLLSGASAPFNTGRSTLVETPQARESHLAAFTRLKGLDIAVDDATRLCDDTCQTGLGVAFAHAVAIWRSGCERCDADKLSLVKLGRTVWLDARAVERLRQSPLPDLDLRHRLGDELQREIPAPDLSVPRTSIVAFEEISSDSALVQKVCTLPDTTGSWIEGAHQLLCGRARDDSGIIGHPHVKLTLGATTCGPATDFIACGLPDLGIELAVEGSRFDIPSLSGVRRLERDAGPDVAPIDIRRVVLHEVGHWFGVPHSNVAGPGAIVDIMGETYGDGKLCVSGQGMVMLNNAADTRWPYRVTQGNGLRRPHAGTSHATFAR